MSNYVYDGDRNSAGALFSPASVTLNTTAVGPFAANQIATITFPAGSITGGDAAPSIKIGTKTLLPSTVAAPTQFTKIAATDATPATVGTIALSTGSTAATAVTAGTDVNLTAILTDADSRPAAAQYRFVRPDGTVTDWSNFTLTDGLANESNEGINAVVKTTGFAPGTYTLETRTVNAEGDVATVRQATRLFISGTDATAPALTAAIADNAAVVTLPTAATTARPAYTYTLEGVSFTDATSNIKQIQYRVQEFNAVTNTFTTVEDWSNATPQDGAYDERTEAANFTTKALTPGKSYRVQVRALDVNNNASAPVTVTAETAAAGVVLPTGAATGLTAAGAAGAADGIFTVDAVVAALPSATGGEAVAPALDADQAGSSFANPAGTKSVTITGTADGDVANAAGANTQTVSKVEYAVYKDADNNGSYETTVTDFTTVGVTANDGAFDEAVEAYTIDYSVPTDGAYRLVTRVTNTAGNTADSAALNTWVDTTAPTATIAPNTDTAATNDFIVTFSEVVDTTAAAADGTFTSSALDEDNFTLRLASGQIIDTATTVTQVGATNAFIVTFGNTDTPVAGTTVNVANVRDVANNNGALGNLIVPFSYVIK